MRTILGLSFLLAGRIGYAQPGPPPGPCEYPSLHQPIDLSGDGVPDVRLGSSRTGRADLNNSSGHRTRGFSCRHTAQFLMELDLRGNALPLLLSKGIGLDRIRLESMIVEGHWKWVMATYR